MILFWKLFRVFLLLNWLVYLVSVKGYLLDWCCCYLWFCRRRKFMIRLKIVCISWLVVWKWCFLCCWFCCCWSRGYWVWVSFLFIVLCVRFLFFILLRFFMWFCRKISCMLLIFVCVICFWLGSLYYWKSVYLFWLYYWYLCRNWFIRIFVLFMMLVSWYCVVYCCFWCVGKVWWLLVSLVLGKVFC